MVCMCESGWGGVCAGESHSREGSKVICKRGVEGGRRPTAGPGRRRVSSAKPVSFGEQIGWSGSQGVWVKVHLHGIFGAEPSGGFALVLPSWTA